MTGNLIRDLFEGLFVVAIGGTTWSAITKLRRHQIPVLRCGACGRPISRTYAHCPRCGA